MKGWTCGGCVEYGFKGEHGVPQSINPSIDQSIDRSVGRGRGACAAYKVRVRAFSRVLYEDAHWLHLDHLISTSSCRCGLHQSEAIRHIHPCRETRQGETKAAWFLTGFRESSVQATLPEMDAIAHGPVYIRSQYSSPTICPRVLFERSAKKLDLASAPAPLRLNGRWLVLKGQHARSTAK